MNVFGYILISECLARKAMLTKAAIKKAAEDACKNIGEFDCNDLDENLNTIIVVCIALSSALC